MPHQAQAASHVAETPQSKSLLAGLLKRESKAPQADARSKSLFDKNFLFGLAAGLILGFLVIPMVLPSAPEPAYIPVAEISAPVAELEISEGESFVDAALAEDVP
ncbi:hypothetical protein [Litorimonas sp. WD9-15]|uniref:hypothetical protein n=1 Tax=Litorimonas sp. WD9-15 TaxID=3418716 RepID=UPI003D0867D6